MDKPTIIVIVPGSFNSSNYPELYLSASNVGKKLEMRRTLPNKGRIKSGDVEKIIIVKPQQKESYERFKMFTQNEGITIQETPHLDNVACLIRT